MVDVDDSSSRVMAEIMRYMMVFGLIRPTEVVDAYRWFPLRDRSLIFSLSSNGFSFLVWGFLFLLWVSVDYSHLELKTRWVVKIMNL